MKVFVSFTTRNQQAADDFVETLRLHYIDFFYSPRTIKGGYFAEDIRKGLDQAHKFVVLLSPEALQSEWVRQEVAMAMDDPKFRGSILPVLIEPTPDWTSIHPHIHRIQAFHLYADPEEVWTRILEDELRIRRHRHEYYRVGDVVIPVLIFVGGDGVTTYRVGDIETTGPEQSNRFKLPDDLQFDAQDRLAQIKATCDEAGQLFVNNPQVRLCDASWGGAGGTGGLTVKPLRLTLGWTEYYSTRLTNQSHRYVLPDGQSVEMKYAPDEADLANSRLSNPIACNMTVVTSDRRIYLSTRSSKVAWNPGQFQPAVSGDGQPEDIDEQGTYDPFRTAIRETMEECTGLLKPTPDQVTFFGLARTMGTQFPFLFGEIRLDVSSKVMESYQPLNAFEGKRFSIPFTVEAVTDWIRKYHRDYFEGRRGGVIGTTLFSLLQSLHYEFPEEWPEVIRRLIHEP